MKPLYDVTLERALCGFLSSSRPIEEMFQVFALVFPEDFYEPKTRAIAQQCFNTIAEGKQPDLMLIHKALDGMVTLSELIGMGHDYTMLDQALRYAAIVQEYSKKRKLVGILSTAHENMDTEESGTLITQVVEKALSLSMEIKVDDDGQSMVKELQAVQEEYQRKYEAGQKYIGFPCGISKVDDTIDGMRSGHVWVVGAWTSTGKTQFALNVVNNVLAQNIPVTIFSLEMSRVDTLARLIGIRENVSSMAVLKARTHKPEDYQRIQAAQQFFTTAPIHVHTEVFELERIKMVIRRDARFYGTKLFVIDYIQNILAAGNETEYQTITRAVTELQGLARALGVTVFLVSQINNESLKGGSMAAGFKGSGTIEAVADIAIRLERDKKAELPEWDHVPLKIIIHKARHGFSGLISDHYLCLKTGRISYSAFPPHLQLPPAYGDK